MISAPLRFGLASLSIFGISCGLLACSSSAGDAAESTESDVGTCPNDAHECAAWGATCNGDTLETCVVDARGCRVRLVETCDLGCSAGACNTCRRLSEPKLGASLDDQSAWYRHAVKRGDFVYAPWDERHQQYSGPAYGLAVVDVSNPAAPVTADVVTFAAGDYSTRLAVSGDKLYALQKDRAQIYDLSTPTNPVALGSYAATATPNAWPTTATQRAISVDGTIACIAADDGLHVVDVSSPSAPARLGLVPSPGYRSSAVAFAKGYAAVVAYDTLRVVDVRVPTAPVVAAEVKLGGVVYDFAGDVLRFDGARAWVASQVSHYDTTTGLLEAFDFTPSTPSSAASITRVSALAGLPVIDGFVLSGDDLLFRTSSSVGSIDLAHAGGPAMTKHVVTGSVRGIAAAGKVVLASGDEGIEAVDLSKAPDVRIQPSSDWPAGAETHGSVAYLARGSGGFVILDVRDPVAPTVLSKTDAYATSISLDGHRAYVTVADDGRLGGGDELRVYDVESPWEPRLLGAYVEHRSYASTRTMDDVVASGGRAYAICEGGQLCAFDVSAGGAPSLLARTASLAQYVAYGNRAAFTASGTRVYLAKPDALTIANLADAANPVVEGSLALGGYAGAQSEDTRIALGAGGATAYVLYDCFYDTPAGLRCLDAIDVSNPAAPAKLGHLAFAAGYTQVEGWDHSDVGEMRVVADRLYLTTPAGGVVVIDVSNPATPAILGRLWTKGFANGAFVTGRFATASVGQPYGASPGSGSTQVIEMCKP